MFFHVCIVEVILPQKLMNLSKTHGLQGDNTIVNSRGHRDSRTKGHYTEPRRHPPYPFNYQNQPRTQVQKPTSDTIGA